MTTTNLNQDGNARLMRGRQTFARAIRALLIRNSLSHAEMRQLSEWACPWGRDWLSTSQLSYLRGGKLAHPGAKNFDAIGQINLRLAQLTGDDGPEVDALPELPKLPRDLRTKLEAPFFLRHPQTKLALTAGDLFMVWVGRIIPANLSLDAFTAEQAAHLSSAISAAAQTWAIDQGKLLTDALPEILSFYGASDKARRDRLKSVIFGLDTYRADELPSELEALHCLADGILDDGNVADRWQFRALLAQGDELA